MNQTRTAAEFEYRALRAVVFLLSVLAQLLLPAIVLRAQASAGELCATRSNQSVPNDSQSHAHDGQCTGCTLHHAAPFVPPVAVPLPAGPVQIGFVSLGADADFIVSPRHAQPPPTGPPTL